VITDPLQTYTPGFDAAVPEAASAAPDLDGASDSEVGPPPVGPVGGVAAISTPCPKPAALACADHAGKVTLICSGNPPVWTANTTCGNAQFCDSRPGPNQGTCAVGDPVCTILPPGATTCSADRTTIVTCGPDLVSNIPVAACPNQTCVAGACSGVCAPSQTRCEGQQPQSCGPDGQWQDNGACTASQTCIDGACGGVCGPTQAQCAGSQPQTCTAAGQWQDAGPSCSDALGSFCSGGSCRHPPSCTASAPATLACGAAGENCCTSPAVPPGTFYRDYVNDGTGPTQQASSATVSAFRLDKYDVTVGRFRVFVDAWTNGYRPPAGSGKHTHLNGGLGLVNSDPAVVGNPDPSLHYEPGWIPGDNAYLALTTSNLICSMATPPASTWTVTPGADEKLPMNCVDWYEAYAFCIWDGGFLPSEAEYAYAAAGGSEDREYPWGSTPPGTASQYAIYFYYYPDGSGTFLGVPNFAPVGTATLGAGKWTQLDLVGEVFQWSLDYVEQYTGCVDCANTTANMERVFRGSGFGNEEGFLVPTFRGYAYADGRGDPVGFRCARSP
jgi:formylglycine-generating enzyme required for sulfatase activity